MKPNTTLLLLFICPPLCRAVLMQKGSSDPTMNTTTTTQTATDYLTQKGWILVAERTNTDNGAWTDIYSTYPSCQKDIS